MQRTGGVKYAHKHKETVGIGSPPLRWHRWECREKVRCVCPQSLLWKVSNPLFQHNYEFNSEVTPSWCW